MKQIFLIVSLFTISTNIFAESLVTTKSSYSFEKTRDLVLNMIKKKGLVHFSTIDHKTGADSIGLKLQKTSVIIFGNPKVGTLMMQNNPLIGIDLPMKVLVFQRNKDVFIAYKKVNSLKRDYAIKGMDKIFTKVSALFRLISKTIKK